MIPAPAQGALALECRDDDAATIGLLGVLDDVDSRRTVAAERAFLAALGGGCTTPGGAHATVGSDGTLTVVGMLGDPLSGDVVRRTRASYVPGQDEEAGRALADEIRNALGLP